MSEPDRCPRPVYALPLAAIVGYLAVAAYLLDGRIGLPLDDSYIHLVFARSLAEGRGLAFPASPLVAGSTAPLWTVVLAVLAALPGSLVGWSVAVGCGLFLAVVASTYALARGLGAGRGTAVLAAAWVALADGLVWAALSGMEVHLFTLLALAGCRRALVERRLPAALPLALPLFGLAALARPEGLLLLVLAFADQLLAGCAGVRASARLARVAVGLAIAALPLAGVVAFNLTVGGTPLPSTFAAKTSGALAALPHAQYLHVVWGLVFRPLPVAAVLFAGGALRLAEWLGSPRDRGLLVPAWVLALPLAYALLSPPGQALVVGNFGRYFLPLLPFVAVLAALAVEPLAVRLAASAAGRRVRLALVVAVLVPTVVTCERGATRYAQNVMNVEDSDLLLGRLLMDRVPVDALLAVQDVGAVGWLVPNPLLDLAGILSPELVARVRADASRGDLGGEAAMRQVLAERRPELVVAFPAWFPAIQADRRLLTPILELAIAGNITMGGDRLRTYATPWTRPGLVERLLEDPAGAAPAPNPPPAR